MMLSDEEMRKIANRMGSAHTDKGYWEDLIDSTNRILEEKVNKQIALIDTSDA